VKHCSNYEEYHCYQLNTDQIFCMCQDTGGKWENSETVHQLFVDSKKIYDSVRKEDV
jgi:hypothetical protein